MKKNLLWTISTLLFCIFNFSNIKSQSVIWIKKGMSPGFENGNAIVADDSGNVYVTGQIEYTSLFDGYSLESFGQHDIVVIKYDADGVVKWIRFAGGTDGDIGMGIGIDSKHNVYITGEIEQTVSFGNGISLTSSGGNDGFIAKYDVNGNIVWAKRFGHSSSSDKSRAIAVSPSGNCFITGNFSSTATFGSTSLSSNGGNDIFVVRYDTNGNVVWAKKAGGSKQDRGFGIAIDASENVYVTGSFTSPATFRNTTITNSGKLSAFIAKYNSGGTFQWVKGGGDCCDTTQANAIAIDGSGNIFITGSFAVKAKFSSVTLTSSGLSDIFIAKYDNAGTLQWAKKAGGPQEDIGYGITYNPLVNRIYVTGFVGSAGSAGSLSYSFDGYKDVFLGSFSANSGSEKWVKTYGGPWRDVGLAITVNSQGYIYTTGLFNGIANFGPYTITSSPNSYWADLFVMKIMPPAGLSPVINQDDVSYYRTSEKNIELDELSIYPNPFNTNFILKTPHAVNLHIYDTYGKLIYHRKNVSGEIIGGENLPVGNYYIVVSDDIFSKTIRVLKVE